MAEGVGSDGDVYGRAFQLPDRKTPRGPGPHGGTDIERLKIPVLKGHLGDIPSCPCLAALASDDRGPDPAFEAAGPAPRAEVSHA